jgi:hypothetical protein
VTHAGAIDSASERVFAASWQEEAGAGPAPAASDHLAEAKPLDLAGVEGLLQEFLDGLADLRQEAEGWLTGLGPWPWVFLAASLAAACELARRRHGRGAGGGPSGEHEAALTWFPGLNGPV